MCNLHVGLARDQTPFDLVPRQDEVPPGMGSSARLGGVEGISATHEYIPRKNTIVSAMVNPQSICTSGSFQ